MVRHHGSEDNTLGPDDCKAYGPLAPSQTQTLKLLIYRLFQKGRVLAQDGDYACMISSFVRARPWARPQTQTLSC